MIKNSIRKFARQLGYDLIRFSPISHPIARRKRILELFEIDTVLDIGANIGQFAQELRDIGYSKRIISFEPLSLAYNLLKKNAKGDPSWEVVNCALGDTAGNFEINIAGNSYSSSFLEILPAHIYAAPESQYKGKELVKIEKLDDLFSSLCSDSKNVYMKIDTQGFESKVLAGAEQSILIINTIQMEMSLTPLYEGELLFNELCSIMYEKNFKLISIEQGFSDPESLKLLQVDGTFHRYGQ